MKNTFTASMDNYASEITAAVTLISFGLLIAQFFIFQVSGKIISISLLAILVTTYSRAYFFKTINYQVTDDFLIIHRLVSDLIIPIKNLNKIELLDTQKVICRNSVWMILGLFGYFGKFADEKIGNFTMYATRKNKKVLIETTDNKKVIVTPDKPVKFVKQLLNLKSTPLY